MALFTAADSVVTVKTYLKSKQPFGDDVGVISQKMGIPAHALFASSFLPMLPGFVYVFSNPGLTAYKVGMSTRPLYLSRDELQRQYGTVYPFEIESRHAVDDPAAVEAMAHRILGRGCSCFSLSAWSRSGDRGGHTSDVSGCFDTPRRSSKLWTRPRSCRAGWAADCGSRSPPRRSNNAAMDARAICCAFSARLAFFAVSARRSDGRASSSGMRSTGVCSRCAGLPVGRSWRISVKLFVGHGLTCIVC